MSVSLRAAVLGASLLALSPIPAHAAAIVSGLTGTRCGALGGPSTSCTVFEVDPFTTVSFSGQFEFGNDVALFAFVLTGQTTFSAATNSYAAGGFDPTIGLFLQNGTIVQYPDPNPAVPVAFYPAYGVDVDPDPNNPNYDDILPTLLLDPGTYYLALIEYGNFFKSDLNGLDSLRAGFASDDFAGACSQDGVRTCGFSLTLTARPVDTTPVPEPGTLSLLALGAAGVALLRRRRTHRLTNTP